MFLNLTSCPARSALPAASTCDMCCESSDSAAVECVYNAAEQRRHMRKRHQRGALADVGAALRHMFLWCS